MKKIILFILALLMPLVNAETPLQEFFSDDVTNLEITIKEDESTASFYMDTAGTSFDVIDFTYEDFTIENLYISALMEGINGDVKLEKYFKYPQFENIEIQMGSIAQFVMDNAFIFGNVDLTCEEINQDNSLLTAFASRHPFEKEFDRTSILIKNNNDYKLWISTGFGSIKTSYLNKIKSIITESVYSLNIKEILSMYIPIETDLIDFIEYEISLIDLNNIELKDGTYEVEIKIIHDTTVVYKTIQITLEGIIVPECYTNNDCSDNLFCNGIEVCDNGNCRAGTKIDCSDNLFCSVNEICDENLDMCISDARDCSSYDEGEIARCEGFYWWYRPEHISECDENRDTCSECPQISKTLSEDCGVTCLIDDDCSETLCSHLNGCVSDDYYEYADLENNCVDYVCEANQCVPEISYNDERCICDEEWICDEWTECINEIQTRSCIDLNECGTEENKPIAEQTCEMPCIPNIINKYSEWFNISECLEDNTINKGRTKLTYDYNNCGMEDILSYEYKTIDCVYEPPCVPDWVLGNWTECVDNKKSNYFIDLNNCGIEREHWVVDCTPEWKVKNGNFVYNNTRNTTLNIQIISEIDIEVEIKPNEVYYFSDIVIKDKKIYILPKQSNVKIESVTYSEEKLTVELDGNGTKEINFYLSDLGLPQKILFDNNVVTQYNFNNSILTFNVVLGSPHTIELDWTEEVEPEPIRRSSGGSYSRDSPIMIDEVIVVKPKPKKKEEKIIICNDLYWFDKDNRNCGYKEFCGAFLYESLRTYETIGECLTALGKIYPTVILEKKEKFWTPLVIVLTIVFLIAIILCLYFGLRKKKDEK